MTETIALFGATGGSGSEVLSAALEKGYRVRVMVRTPAKVQVEHPNLTVIRGDFASTEAIRETVGDADYVISTVGGPTGKPEEFPVGAILAFVRDLVEAMKAAPSVKVFLHQSGAFCPHPDGSKPPTSMRFMAKVVGEWVAGIGPNIAENVNIMKFMDSIQGEVNFKTIATRPGALYKGEGGRKVVATASPPIGVTTFKDLGTFTVEAIKDESLYGKYPFVAYQPSAWSNTSLIVGVAVLAAGYMAYTRK